MKLIKKFMDKKANTIHENDEVILALDNGEPQPITVDKMVMGERGIVISAKGTNDRFVWPLDNVSMIVFKDGRTGVNRDSIRPSTDPVPKGVQVIDLDEEDEDIDTTLIMLRKDLNVARRNLSDNAIKIARIWDAEADGVPVDYESDEYHNLQGTQYALSKKISMLEETIQDMYNEGEDY